MRTSDHGQSVGYRLSAIATYLIHKAGFPKAAADTGAVTLIQRFGSSLNLNIHFHMLFLDGAYTGRAHRCTAWFRSVKAPTGVELTQLVHTIYAETCSECGSDVRVIARIENPEVIRKILDHLEAKGVLA